MSGQCSILLINALQLPTLLQLTQYRIRSLHDFLGHCFRKRLWTERPSPDDASRWERAIDYLESHTEIRDVLLSGGDPLTLADDWLAAILDSESRM